MFANIKFVESRKIHYNAISRVRQISLVSCHLERSPLLQPSFLKGRPASGSYVMSLFPDEDVLIKEIESWRGFADSLPVEEDRTDFMKMLNDCYKYSKAINAKGRPFPTEPLIVALLFSQHKLIVWLEDQIRSPGL
jgi:hypothetical protein